MNHALEPVLAAFRSPQRKPTIILLCSAFLLIAWKYGGSPEFYQQWLRPYGVLFDDPAATAGMYSLVSCFVLLGVVPAAIVKLLFHERLADYGVQLGDRRRTFRSMLLLAPLFVLGGYLASRDPAVAAVYPINPAAGRMFGLHAVTYVLFYLGWEFYFRGFMQLGLRESLGDTNALLVQVLASTLLHIGKPGSEAFGAIFGGLLWGVLVYRTRSLLSGLVQHALLGLSLDWFLCYG
jgi:membrane protease YdiL (CAAX protease family)